MIKFSGAKTSYAVAKIYETSHSTTALIVNSMAHIVYLISKMKSLSKIDQQTDFDFAQKFLTIRVNQICAPEMKFSSEVFPPKHNPIRVTAYECRGTLYPKLIEK